MLEPVMIVKLDMMNKATIRDATSLAIFNDNMGFSCGLPLRARVYQKVIDPESLVAVTVGQLLGS